MRCRTYLFIRFAMHWAKFWAPVPWLLEAAIVLELVLNKYLESSGYCKPADL